MISFSKTVNTQASFHGFSFMTYSQNKGSCTLSGKYKDKHRYFMVNKKFKFNLNKFKFRLSLISYNNKLVSNYADITKKGS